MTITDSKRQLRTAMYQTLADFCATGAMAAASEKACAAVLGLPEFAAADTILAYMPMPQEADCAALFAAAFAGGKQLLLPRVVRGSSDMDFYTLSAAMPLSAQTESGSYNIREPKTTLPRFMPEDCSGSIFVVVPGVAFTRGGARLGHGKGFYDRYIARLKQSGARLTLCGFCFDVQLVGAIPCDGYDVPMDYVASESGICDCRLRSL